MRYRIKLHQPPEETIRGTERVSLNGQRKRHVGDKEVTQQGDPLSSLLFNTVLQMALKDDVERWQNSKSMGKRLGDYESDCLTNLRFADDVLLFSICWCSSQNDVPDNTKILSNQSTNKRKEVEINTIKVEILSACEYLGQTITYSTLGNS